MERSTTRHNTRWNRNFDALKTYEKDFGHTKVPANFKIKKDGVLINLGTWVAYIRTKHRQGLLTAEEIDCFEQLLGWSWNPKKTGPIRDFKRDKEIQDARESGVLPQQIADRFNISRQRVHQILKQFTKTKV